MVWVYLQLVDASKWPWIEEIKKKIFLSELKWNHIKNQLNLYRKLYNFDAYVIKRSNVGNQGIDSETVEVEPSK